MVKGQRNVAEKRVAWSAMPVAAARESGASWVNANEVQPMPRVGRVGSEQAPRAVRAQNQANTIVCGGSLNCCAKEPKCA